MQVPTYRNGVTELDRADGRSARRSDNRRAILDAAIELAQERGVGGYTADDLAARAGVSRRTVFNHVESLEDALAQGLAAVLNAVVADFLTTANAVPLGEDDPASALQAVSAALHSVDLVRPLSAIAPLLRDTRVPHPALQGWALQSLRLVIDRLADELRRRYSAADDLEVDLLATILANGLGVLVAHWVARTGGVDTPASRAVWEDLVTRFLRGLASGYSTALTSFSTEPPAPGQH